MIMKITDVRLRAVKGENELTLKAYADVIFIIMHLPFFM